MQVKEVAVVGAVIVHQQKVLCARRGGSGPLAGFWEFPGGKLESSESPIQALQREIREELGCDIDVGAELTTTVHDYSFARIALTTFWSSLKRGVPVATEHDKLLWLPPERIAALEWAPADIPAVRIIEGGLGH